VTLFREGDAWGYETVWCEMAGTEGGEGTLEEEFSGIKAVSISRNAEQRADVTQKHSMSLK
jgi:hypothetical protein